MLGKVVCADLHVHTALSPCAAEEMTPKAIVEHALNCHIGVLAITDHNSAANVEAVMHAASETDLIVVPGMEVETIEEVHVVTLFPTLEAVLAWQDIVYKALPQRDNRPEYFGRQIIYGADGEEQDVLDILLLQSTTLTLDVVVNTVHQLGGKAIPAHIDRSTYSVLANLGFIPQDLPISVVEFSRSASTTNLPGYVSIVSSDAHQLFDLYGSPSTAIAVDDIKTCNALTILQSLSPNKVVIF